MKQLEGKPFVLLGVNGDSDREQVRAGVRREGVPWRSWWNGGTSGPLTTQWNISGWPTFYLLDPKGVIRFGAEVLDSDDALDGAIRVLLDEAAAEQKGTS